jgi:hypothetical protein
MDRRIVPVIATSIALGTIGALLLCAEIDWEENNRAEQSRQQMLMTEAPAGVRKTIQNNLEGGTVTETAKETEGDRTYYAAEVQKSVGEKVEIKVAEDGTLIRISTEEEVSPKRVPRHLPGFDYLHGL